MQAPIPGARRAAGEPTGQSVAARQDGGGPAARFGPAGPVPEFQRGFDALHAVVPSLGTAVPPAGSGPAREDGDDTRRAGGIGMTVAAGARAMGCAVGDRQRPGQGQEEEQEGGEGEPARGGAGTGKGFAYWIFRANGAREIAPPEIGQGEGGGTASSGSFSATSHALKVAQRR